MKRATGPVESMTIKELYKWAIERNLEDAEIFFHNLSMMTYYPFTYIEATQDGREVYVS